MEIVPKETLNVDFGFGGKTSHVFCLPICNPSFVMLKLMEGSRSLTSCI